MAGFSTFLWKNKVQVVHSRIIEIKTRYFQMICGEKEGLYILIHKLSTFCG